MSSKSVVEVKAINVIDKCICKNKSDAKSDQSPINVDK